MDELNQLCKTCKHQFKLHQMATFGVWYCDFNDECLCNNFEQQTPPESGEYALEFQYDENDTTYRLN